MIFTPRVRGSYWPFRFRFLLIMKLAIFLTFAFATYAVAESKAQLITLNAKNTPLREVMKAVHKQHGYSFLFRGDEIADTRIDVRIKQLELRAAMGAILRNHGLTWSINDGIITIMDEPNSAVAPPAPTPQRTVAGNIADE